MNEHRHLLPDDPPLTNDGSMELPDDLESLADQLRREATQISEGTAPRGPTAELWSAAHPRATTSNSRFLPRYLTTGLLATALLVLVVAPWIYRPPTGGNSAPPAAQFGDSEPSQNVDLAPLAPRVDRSVFLSSDATSSPVDDEALSEALIAASGAASDQQRIELLERALERYRQALAAQQEQIRQLQEELKQLRGEELR